MARTILVLNPGSSTLKYAYFEDGAEKSTNSIAIDNTGDFRSAVTKILDSIPTRELSAVAYRIVHGGTMFSRPVQIDQQVLLQLQETTHLAPLHQQPAIATIRAALEIAPNALHIGCFDTAFHATLPIEEQMLAIPRKHYDAGIRRYGFHGLSYESIAASLPSISTRASQGKTIVCHLGSGASLCGMVACTSRYTSMSFTPQDGLVMGTRAGKLDSGVILHWLRNGLSATQIEQVLTKESGLLGLSALSADMRQLQRTAATRIESRQAIEIFCRSVAKEIAAASTAIGGLDAIVFTAGIGENCPAIRAKIVDCLQWLNVRIEPAANLANATRLHAAGSSAEVLCIPTDEQKVMLQHALASLTTLDRRL